VLKNSVTSHETKPKPTLFAYCLDIFF
jgi:hypothetical protein